MAIYYVKNDGSDNYSGLSDSSAWQTLNKVNSPGFSYSSSDYILFKRGDIWRGILTVQSGSSTGRITYGSYGSGNKPRILGSLQANNLADWTNISTNIWECNRTEITRDVGNIIFNNDACVGVKHTSAADIGNASCILPMTDQGDFWYNNDNTSVWVYSILNPAAYYSNIELAYQLSGIAITNANYVIINELDIRYVADVGIRFTGSCSNILISNCDTNFIGGTEYNPGGGYRQGNAIQLWARDSGYNDVYDNIKIEYCKSIETYDTAFSFQGGSEEGSATITNLDYHHNIIVNAEWPLEFWLNGSNSLISDVYLQNNTTIDAGGQKQHFQRWDGKSASHFIVWQIATTDVSRFRVRNNIFSSKPGINNLPGQGWFCTIYYDVSLIGKIDLGYNLYDIPRHTEDNAWIGGIIYDYYYPLADWQTHIGIDINSVEGDPSFNNRDSYDFSLKSNSLAIGNGVNAGYTRDFAGNPIASSPAIGAYEFFEEANTFLFGQNGALYVYNGGYLIN